MLPGREAVGRAKGTYFLYVPYWVALIVIWFREKIKSRWKKKISKKLYVPGWKINCMFQYFRKKNIRHGWFVFKKKLHIRFFIIILRFYIIRYCYRLSAIWKNIAPCESAKRGPKEIILCGTTGTNTTA